MPTILEHAVSPRSEMLAYETLWAKHGTTQKRIAEMYEKHAASQPSELLKSLRDQSLFDDFDDIYPIVERYAMSLAGFSVCVHGTFQYPKRLRAADYPPELFYYRGDIGLLDSTCVSIVGARQATEDGKKRAAQIARDLVREKYTIVSGLATGIDTAAMKSAIDHGGHTVGVIGTPITISFPKENEDLQETVASHHLLISQVPFYRYQNEPWNARKAYFPQRNVTMAALSEATIIVEASETSGTLTQARAALKQGRKLFILNSCFDNKAITWPKLFEERGAIRVRTTQDVLDKLERPQDEHVESD